MYKSINVSCVVHTVYVICIYVLLS